jgi:hypothetical protein
VRVFAIALTLGILAGGARADEIPVVTLSDVGPNQDVPTHHSFFVAGDLTSSIEIVQAIVVRKGSPSMLGDDGPACHDVLAGLHLESAATTGADEEDDDEDPTLTMPLPRYVAGRHRAFEVFARAEPDLRDSDVLVSAAWQRGGDNSHQYKVLVPHDSDFFSAGYSYCLFVVATERAQEIDDGRLTEMIEKLAGSFVSCGDKSSCDNDALADYETHAARELASTRSGIAGSTIARTVTSANLKEAARMQLANATAIVEARDHLADRWNGEAKLLAPATQTVWADVATDPFAHATATMLARTAALLPQVRGGKRGTEVALYTTDGKLAVGALQILDDGRSIRVASSKAPTGGQARVLTATTDTLPISDDLVLYDLIELGHGRIHVDKQWTTLTALGEHLGQIGLDGWGPEDSAYLAAAAAQLHRLADFVDLATSGASCPQKSLDTGEADQAGNAVRRHLGEWLVCQHADTSALQAMAEQLDELVHEDQSWKETKRELVARSKRIVTLTTTAPLPTRVSFSSPTWVFSYVTPIVGYAGIIRPDESFGLFYLGAQVHLDPNPVGDVLWRDGVTTKDLRRAVALEVGLTPSTSSFGPDHRYEGIAGLPPIFVGLAVHVLPYTSLTVGGTILDRKMSSLPQEQPSAVFSPYVGFTLQLNVPDLLREASRPSSDTSATR